MNDLSEVRECLIQILRALPEQPGRLRLSAGEVTIELAWPDVAVPGGGYLAAGTAGTLSAANGAGGAVGAEANGGTGAAPAAAAQDLVCSPSVGTFYRAPEPGAPPFVAEGDVVQPGQQIAIVEVMKLMLPVEAGRSGRVAKILKTDGEPVEYGEPLVELVAVGEVG